MKKLILSIVLIASSSAFSSEVALTPEVPTYLGVQCLVKDPSQEKAMRVILKEVGAKSIKPILWAWRTHADCYGFRENISEQGQRSLEISYIKVGMEGCSESYTFEHGTKYSVSPNKDGIYMLLDAQAELPDGIHIACSVYQPNFKP